MSLLSDLQSYAHSNVSAYCLPATFEMNLENLPHPQNEFLWKALLERFMQIFDFGNHFLTSSKFEGMIKLL